MFFHGINWEYVKREYPVLSPRRTVSQKKQDQWLDRIHLIQQFGIEPIHLLEADEEYSSLRCMEECYAFGDTVFAFEKLTPPMWQLSSHEIGVEILDLRTSKRIYTFRTGSKVEEWFPGIPCIRTSVPVIFREAIDSGKIRLYD